MDEMEQRLGAILSDPVSMSKIMDLARGLGLSPPTAEAPVGSAAQQAEAGTAPVGDAVPPALNALLGSIGGPDDRQTVLLKALRPYLRTERQDRLDRALQTARMVKLAKQVMKQFHP